MQIERFVEVLELADREEGGGVDAQSPEVLCFGRPMSLDSRRYGDSAAESVGNITKACKQTIIAKGAHFSLL